MLILEEQQLSADISLLARAWDGKETFLVLPSPRPVQDNWISDAIARLPAELLHGHFGLLTSGSTESPKLVIGKKDRTLALVRRIHEAQSLESITTAILTLPLGYSYSLVNQWIWSHAYERKLIQTQGLADPKLLVSVLTSCRDAMLCLVGSQIPIFKRVFPHNSRFLGVHRINFAGAPFPQSELPWLETVFPNAVVLHNYGCTEALPRLTIRQAYASSDPMVLGDPLPGITLSVGADSQLRFTSPYSAVAIASETEVSIIRKDELIPTGDLAETQSDGRIRLIGRASEVFKRHGEKLSLVTISNLVKDHWSGNFGLYIERAMDGELGYVLSLEASPKNVDVRQLLMGFRSRSKRTHWPIRIVATEKIPLTDNGKPNVKALQLQDSITLWKQML